MSKSTKLMGTACFLATALVAGPAAANSLTGFTAMLDTHYTHSTYSSFDPVPTAGPFNETWEQGDAWNSWSFGGSIAMPVADVPGINWQVDAQYAHRWGSDAHLCNDIDGCSAIAQSAEAWDFGFSPFWAGEQGRVGINLNYNTTTHWGHLTNGGVFGEWYFGPITAAAKAGWLSAGGTPTGGHGNYYGGAVTFYALPNLSITGSVTWSDLVTGSTLVSVSNPGCFASVCGRRDWNQLTYGAVVEFLVSEALPFSVYGGISYTQYTRTENAVIPGDDFTSLNWLVGLRFYPGSGQLINKHRDGNLFSWLRGPG